MEAARQSLLVVFFSLFLKTVETGLVKKEICCAEITLKEFFMESKVVRVWFDLKG